MRLQATAPTDDLELRPINAAYQELSIRAIALRKVLARVPDEMGDRRTFLETIKEIASSIKKLLDATNAILQVSARNSLFSGGFIVCSFSWYHMFFFRQYHQVHSRRWKSENVNLFTIQNDLAILSRNTLRIRMRLKCPYRPISSSFRRR